MGATLMFNVQMFLMTLVLLALATALLANAYVVWRHRWMPLRIACLIVALLSIAAAVGVLCA